MRVSIKHWCSVVEAIKISSAFWIRMEYTKIWHSSKFFLLLPHIPRGFLYNLVTVWSRYTAEGKQILTILMQRYREKCEPRSFTVTVLA